jgi:hypothetical protein
MMARTGPRRTRVARAAAALLVLMTAASCGGCGNAAHPAKPPTVSPPKRLTGVPGKAYEERSLALPDVVTTG